MTIKFVNCKYRGIDVENKGRTLVSNSNIVNRCVCIHIYMYEMKGPLGPVVLISKAPLLVDYKRSN